MSTTALADLARRIQQWMRRTLATQSAKEHPSRLDDEFNAFALELHSLQLSDNPAYAALCRTQGAVPGVVKHWRAIPAVPVSAFKQLEMTSLPPEQRIAMFCSSGTTGHVPSRHFHNAESLVLYEASLLEWFRVCAGSVTKADVLAPEDHPALFVSLTPDSQEAPHSSLVHMFETVSRHFGAAGSICCGRVEAEGTWLVDLTSFENALTEARRADRPIFLLGTAFNFVHLLEAEAARAGLFQLPAGSRVLETGGYKGRVRSKPKEQLHRELSDQLGVAKEAIVSEYGMSELSSQAYDRAWNPNDPKVTSRSFRFPPWARVVVVSPETGDEVAEGEPGLLRIWDLANVWSALAIQTEDLGIRRGVGFELMGRATLAEPRGCSLMAKA